MADTNSAVSSFPSDKLLSTFNMWKPEVALDYYRIFGDQGMSMFKNLRSLNMVFQVNQDERTTYSEEKIHPTVHIGSGGITTVSAPAGT